MPYTLEELKAKQATGEIPAVPAGSTGGTGKIYKFVL